MNQIISDKIVNHFVVNYYLIPYLEKSLIDENIATRKNKGGSYGIKLLKEYFNKILINHKEVYCLKLDVSKYFYNIDHEILLNKIGKKILDKDVLELIKKIISETNNDYINNYINYINFKHNLDIPYYKDNKGLSIGAETSQFFAIFYLNDLDHYIKEKLRCKYYVRYMDDLVILDDNKDNLIKAFNSIKVELNKLKLEVNNKSNIYKCSNSFKFLGYKWQVVNNKLKISSNNKTYYRIRRRLIKLENSDYLKYIKSKGSYCGYFKVIDKEYGGVFKIKTIDLYNTYKSKYSKNSYNTAFYDSYKCKKNCNIELDLKRRIIKFPKLGNLKIRGYRNIKSINCRLINTTISREKNNKYYVSVLYELPEAPKILPSTIVGLDIVVKKLITMSDGITYDNNEYINKYEERIKREQYKLSKKKKGSKNYYKNKRRLNVLYIKLANARKFYTHKITKYITDNYDIICTESLNTKQMVMNKKCIYQKIFVMQYLLKY